MIQYHVAAWPSVRDFEGEIPKKIRSEWIPLLEKHDVDAKLFVNETLTADWFESFTAFERCTDLYYSGPPSFKRNLEPFIGSQFAAKTLQVNNTINVFNF